LKIAHLNKAFICLFGILTCNNVLAAELDGGHVRLNNTQSLSSSTRSPYNLEGRLKLKGGSSPWRWQIDVIGDVNHDCNLECSNGTKIDRANISYKHQNINFTIGRHAISWGNGLIFNPVDIFNPFDPLAINRDYKPGDDMLHAEIARSNGDNVQFLYVNHESEYSLASKYHGFYEDLEYDVLVARHFDETIASVGLSASIGDWLWRGDIQHQGLIGGDSAQSLVTNLQRFFEFQGKPTSLTLEWYHNGFGLSETPSMQDLQHLFKRMARGELFSPGKDYLAIALMSQMSALWNMGVTSISEAQNDQHIVQITSHHSLTNDVEFIVALNLPWGSDYWSNKLNTQVSELSLSAQLSWYF
jgi:hypothetical protein